MQVKSFLLFPKQGFLKELITATNGIRGCEATPSENQEVAILVTDVDFEQQEEEILKKVQALTSFSHMTLVSGFNEDSN